MRCPDVKHDLPTNIANFLEDFVVFELVLDSRGLVKQGLEHEEKVFDDLVAHLLCLGRLVEAVDQVIC